LPNFFIDVTGTSVIVTTLFPHSPTSTTVVTDYLFAPEHIAAPDFDPSEIVEFSELVAGQDYSVCEIVQRGVASKHFDHGVLSPKDALVVNFIECYRQALGTATTA
jgi:Rieske 2Fe-2S family protein